MRQPDRQSGLTIIEVEAMVALLSAIALLMAPSVSRVLHSGRLAQEQQRLKQTLRLTQQQAIAEDRTYRIVWNLVGNSWTTLYFDDVAFVAIREDSLDEKVSLVSTTFVGNQLDFDHLGTPSSGGSIVLQDTSGAKRQVEIIAGSGLIRLP